jgi:putative hydrolase of the HAD superfamily
LGGEAANGPRAVLFDLDDTLLTDDSLTEKSWRTACRRFAPRTPGYSADELYAAIRAASREYWGDWENHRKGRLDLYTARREVVKVALAHLNLVPSGLAVELADAYTAEKEEATELIPGAVETLRALKKKGLRLALITNGSHEVQSRKIRKFGLGPFFNIILIEGDFGPGKPDARIFQSALDNLRVAAPAAWMVGDDLSRDVAGARNLGIFSIWVDWRGAGLPPDAPVQPDRIIRDLPQLLEISPLARQRLAS